MPARNTAAQIQVLQAFTDDDGRVNDTTLDASDSGRCTSGELKQKNSCDPAAGGVDPKARHPDNRAACKALRTRNAELVRIVEANTYPGYFCTVWLSLRNRGQTPAKISAALVDGRVLVPNVPASFDSSADALPDVTVRLTGIQVCQELAPGETIWLGLEHKTLYTAQPKALLAHTAQVYLNDSCQAIADPHRQIHSARLENSRIVEYRLSQIPEATIASTPFEAKPDEAVTGELLPDKIHPALKEMLTTQAPTAQNENIQALINFTDPLKIPTFPEPLFDEPRDSKANQEALRQAEALIAQIKSARAEHSQQRTLALAQSYQIKVLEEFWLINAVLVEMPLNSVQSLAAQSDVLYIEPAATEAPPPIDSNPNNDVDDGRARMNSDPYFNSGLTAGWIGLLDTGMRFTHTVFNTPSHIAFRRDCVNGGADCNTGTSLNPNDDCWNHGTSSAAIITANANQGDAFRGVTGITLDSWKVYPTSFGLNGLCNGNLDSAAAVRGFQAAVGALDRVIVAEMQAGGDHTSSISAAADSAFDAGSVIIAANGNNGPSAGTVNSPANAHKAIGVGNFDVETLAQITGQSRGPTSDNRIKPDIQAPTNTETASNGCGWQQNCTTGGSDTATWVFSGTSGATPYAAGAAALLRNWMRMLVPETEPGHVYAGLIQSGQQPSFNNTTGAGPINMPTDGWMWFGKTTVSNGATIDIPLPVNNASNRLDGALWWPETASQQHNDVDMALINPSGVQQASSASVASVFERAQVNGPISAGTWTLRIRGFSVPTGSQTVYWFVFLRF